MPGITDKIRSLLSRAKHDDGPEGEIAAKLAAQLMAKHAVEVDLSDKRSADLFKEERINIGHANWRRRLYTVLAQHCSCELCWGGASVWIFGREDDIDVARYLYALCERQIKKAGDTFIKEWTEKHSLDQFGFLNGKIVTYKRRPGRGLKRKVRNAFNHNAVDGLRDKILAMKEEAYAAENATALVTLREEQVKAEFEAKNPDLRNHKTNYYGCPEGYAAGSNIQLTAGCGTATVPEGRQLS